MRKTGFTFITTLLLISCNKKEAKIDGYEINGIVENISDSTIVTLGDFFKPNDSTFVIGGKFRFTGKVEKPKKIVLGIKDTRDFAELWIENSKISFNAEKDKFMDRVINGSEIQKQADIHYERIKPLKKKFESLYQASMDQSLSQIERDSAVMKYSALMPQMTEISENFVKEYPDFLESIALLNRYKREWGKEKSNKYFSKMNKEIKESSNGKEIAYYLSLPTTPKIGDKYVDFSLKNFEEKDIKLSDIKAKYTLVEFWSSWCGPCRKSNPELVKEYEKYKDQGFEIIGVSLDQNKESWINAIEKDGLTWTNVIDLKGFEGDVSLIYNVNGIPDNFLMDQNGIIIDRRLRGDKLKNKLEEIFAKQDSL
ncbi:TlpA disulfide reductase family protein [uncultured Aquimarina sp.]|uniref:TlpA disulfide reductase family protein n=1 Tax=uncultured Aquimarina sp. TaxID=575652 RepID=UPI0026255A4A|nr:TlpA disulfide reductase family protein [uncultured Aquimarina sp.]